MFRRLTSADQARPPRLHQHCRWRSSHCPSGAPSAVRPALPFRPSPWSRAPPWLEPPRSSCPHPEVRFWDARGHGRKKAWLFLPGIHSRSLGSSLPWREAPRMKALQTFHCWLDLCPGLHLELRLPCSQVSLSRLILRSRAERVKVRSLYQSCYHQLRKKKNMSRIWVKASNVTDK